MRDPHSEEPPSHSAEFVSPDLRLLNGEQLRRAMLRATFKQAFSEPAGCLVLLGLAELERLGRPDATDAEEALVAQVARLVQQTTGATVVGHEGLGRLSFILPGGARTRRLLHDLTRRIAAATFWGRGRPLRLTPAVGYVALRAARTHDARRSCALAALAEARLHNDLQPVAYRPAARAAAAFILHPSSFILTLAGRLNTVLQVAMTFMLTFVLPFAAYAALYRLGLDVTPVVYLGTVLVLLITSYLIWYEGCHAMRSVQPPEPPPGPSPAASAVIAAYLPNEAATIVETVRTFLAVDYPGRLEVILAYNTPAPLPVEAELQALAQADPRLRLLRVAGSTSKAQNVNAALASVTGAFVGIFDADHHPAPDSFTRAWRWLAAGYDVVQGHCVIRNGDASWLTRLVAVEFETIYAVAHPGRARVHGFGIFGGSNGYWKTEVLRGTRLRASMLTEDIDASLRALLDGRRIASDPLLLSYELAPLTLGALWNQRMRWAQGWFQVSLRHLWAAARSPILTLRQKLGLFHLLAWRELYPWISVQIGAVLAFWVWQGGLDRLNLLIPIFVLTTLLTFSSGPAQVLFAYLLSAPAIRRRRRWYLLYLLCAPLFYSGLKNLISRVAMVKEAFQEKQWKVTPREARPELTRTGADS